MVKPAILFGESRRYIGFVGSCLFLAIASGCSMIAPPTLTPTATPTFTPTFTSTDTPTPTNTLTPTDKPTPTITLTPTPVYNAPGNYPMKNKCIYLYFGVMDRGKGYAASLTVCLMNVNIYQDGRMEFDMYYAVVPPPNFEGDVSVLIPGNDRRIALTDNINNTYAFTSFGGCTNKDIKTTKTPKACNGWFVFPPAKPGATSFTFRYPWFRTIYLFKDIVFISSQ